MTKTTSKKRNEVAQEATDAAEPDSLGFGVAKDFLDDHVRYWEDDDPAHLTVGLVCEVGQFCRMVRDAPVGDIDRQELLEQLVNVHFEVVHMVLRLGYGSQEFAEAFERSVKTRHEGASGGGRVSDPLRRPVLMEVRELRRIASVASDEMDEVGERVDILLRALGQEGGSRPDES